jgi:SH3-like domain-containing protein
MSPSSPIPTPSDRRAAGAALAVSAPTGLTSHATRPVAGPRCRACGARKGARWPAIARTLVQGLVAGALALAAVQAAAQSLVSIDRDSVNMRAGAGTRHAVQWELARGYPLRVLTHRGGWLQVEDFEGDRGWVLARLTGRTPHTVVKVKRANLRSAPGTRARVVGQLGYGEVLRTLERRPGWLRVRDSAGRSGWVARRLLWGW